MKTLACGYTVLILVTVNNNTQKEICRQQYMLIRKVHNRSIGGLCQSMHDMNYEVNAR
jgi:hypothetical protein